jgi:hypothetical protein
MRFVWSQLITGTAEGQGCRQEGKFASLPRTLRAGGAVKTLSRYPAVSIGALALGAFAVGALAIGAVAIGALAIGRIKIGHARIARLEVDHLVIRELERKNS